MSIYTRLPKRPLPRTLERRAKRRFPLVRPLRYLVLSKKGSLMATGCGKTIDISSHGIAFETEREWQPGQLLELHMDWDARLDETCPLQLVIAANVLRSNGRRVACWIDRYEFRTRAIPFPAKPTPGRPEREHQTQMVPNQKQICKENYL